MAKKHVVQYFLEVENQFFEMSDLLKEAKALIAEGKFSEENYINLEATTARLRENYERIAYIMFLLNKPNKKNKKEDAVFKAWHEKLRFASKEAILNENKDALAQMKVILKEGYPDNE